MSVLTTVLGGLGGGESVGGALTGAAGKAVGSAAGTLADTGLNAIGAWVLDGTRSALQEVASMIGATTSPDLTSAWFSATYWRVAGLAALLTVPFVFAAALQALLRSDLTLLAKVVFGYVPLSLLAVSLAAPVTMLLLSATDEMCAVVSSSALTGGAHFLDQAATAAGGLSAVGGSPFFAVVIGLLTVAAALTLALELLIREAAVYVVVLMLPLAFAAFVWPARRIWAVRLVELLTSLILAKFVIVAVLSLAGSAFSAQAGGISPLLTAMALVLLSTFAPWTLMRILPFTELAAGAAGALRHELPHAGSRALAMADSGAAAVGDLAASLPATLRRQADQAGQDHLRGPEVPLTPRHADPPPIDPMPQPDTSSVDLTPQTESAVQAPQPFPLENTEPDRRFNAGPGDWHVTEDDD